MKKMFTKKLLKYMVIAFVITIGFIIAMQTFVAKRNNTDSATEKLQLVKERLISNEKNECKRRRAEFFGNAQGC